MTDSIHDIVKRLAVLEGRITPSEPHGSQNPQQKSVHQLPALFKPGKGGPILGGDPNKPAVTKGYFVGAESKEPELNELSSDLLGRAADSAEKRHDAVSRNYDLSSDDLQKLAGHYQGQQQKFQQRAGDVKGKEVAKQLASPATLRKLSIAEDTVEEAQANEEKLLDKVKKSFIDYLDSVEDAVTKKKDKDIGNKAVDKGISKKAKDREIMAKEADQLDEFLPALGALAGRSLAGAEASALTRGAASIAGRMLGTTIQDKLSNDDEVNEDPTQTEPSADTPTAPIQQPTYAAQSSAPVKTITLEDGRICEIHGNEHTGFEIRHGNRRLPSRFRNLDHATMAMEMWQQHCRKQDQSADYIDEA